MKSQETLELLSQVCIIGIEVWRMCILTDVFDLDLTDALDLDLTAVKCNVIVLCNVCMLHTREMLLSLPAAAHCSSVLLLCCCSAAQVQLVGLCNHWVRLHSCTLPVPLLKLLLWLGLGWRVQTFFVSWVSMAWVPWTRKTQQIVQIHLLFMYFLPHWGNNGQKFKDSRITTEVSGVHFVNLEMSRNWKFQNYHWTVWRSPCKSRNVQRMQIPELPLKYF